MGTELLFFYRAGGGGFTSRVKGSRVLLLASGCGAAFPGSIYIMYGWYNSHLLVFQLVAGHFHWGQWGVIFCGGVFLGRGRFVYVLAS